MSSGSIRLSFLGLLFGCLLLAGCNGGGGTVDVTGTASFDGQPIANGEILFHADGGDGTMGGGPIKDGKFTFKVSPGPKKVVITATREEGVAKDGLPNYVSYIPKKYNEQTTLKEEVKSSGENKFDFALTK
jgi:hypothetical protein